MSTATIGTRIKFEGDKEYRESCKKLDQSLGVLGSEMRLLTSQFSDNSKSSEFLTKKQSILEKQFESQSQKVKENEKALNELKNAQGQNVDAVVKFEKALNESKTALAKTEKELKNVEKQVKDTEFSFSNLKKGIADFGEKFKSQINIASVAFTALGGVALNSAMDLEATEAKYNTVFEGFTEQADKMVEDFKKLTPASESATRSMASGLQDLLIPMGFTREQATNLTGDTMGLIGALTNFNSATETSESVSAKFQAALTGETSGLKSLGIQIDAASLEQHILKTNVGLAKDEITKQHKATAILEMATAQSSDALAAYNAESLDTKTKMQLMMNKFQDLGAELLQKFLPMISNLVGFITENAEAFVALTVVIGGAVLGFKAFMIVNSIAKGIGILTGVIKSWDLVTKAMAATQWLINIALTANPIGLIIVGIVALIAAIALLVVEMVKWLKSNEEAMAKIKEFSDTVKEKVTAMVEGIKEKISAVITFFKELPQKIIDFFKSLPQKFKEKFDELLEKFNEWKDGAIENIQTFFEELPEKIMEWIKNIPSMLFEAGKNAIDSFMNGFKSNKEKASIDIQTNAQSINRAIGSTNGSHGDVRGVSGYNANGGSAKVNNTNHNTNVNYYINANSIDENLLKRLKGKEERARMNRRIGLEGV